MRLTDFGLSKMDITDNNAYSVCGTPEYLAPEILYKQGHGKPVDWWCLGSLIYEMVVGLPPFYSKSRPELFDKIKFSNPNIPPYASHKLRNILESFFQKKPESRLGTKGGAAEIKAHPWFDGMNWAGLFERKLKAPFVPLVKSYSDVSNFDPEFTQCEVESFNEASLKSEDGKAYFGFSFDKSKEDKMSLEEGGELELNIK